MVGPKENHFAVCSLYHHSSMDTYKCVVSTKTMLLSVRSPCICNGWWHGCNHWRVPFSNVFLLQCIQSSKPNLTLHYRFWLKFSWGPKYDVLLKEKFCKRWNCHWLKMRNEGSVRQRKTFPIRLTTLCAELCFLLYFGHRKKSQIFYLLEDKMFHPSDLKQKEQTFVFKQQKVSFEKIHQKFFSAFQSLLLVAGVPFLFGRKQTML